MPSDPLLSENMLSDPMLSDEARQAARRGLKAAVEGRLAGEAVRCVRELAGSGKASDRSACASAIAALSKALVGAGYRRLKTFLVRSVTVEPILPFLVTEAVLAGYMLELEVSGYGSYMDELLNPQSRLHAAEPELVVVLLDLEDIAGRLPELCADGRGEGVEAELAESVERVGSLLRSYRGMSQARMVLAGCLVPVSTSLGEVGDANVAASLVYAVGELNRRLATLCRGITDCVFFDLDQAAAQFGRARWRDERMFLATRLPVSLEAFGAFAHGLVRTASTLFRAPRKVLCTDLDNTLWGGVVGEDGAEGIATGSAFPGNCFLAYQRYLKQLAARGILLAIVSKNNEADVAEAFALRAADLGLGLEDFVAKKVGWGEKVDALRELAAELSLGLDAFVFVDDNPVECAAVRLHLPEVAVVEAPMEAPWKLVGMLAAEPFFDAAVITADDANRVQEYKAQAQREALASSTATRDEFLASLGMVCTLVSAADAPLARAVQLLAKTNQFNLTGRRHGAAEVQRFATEPGCQAIAVRVRDRFGDAGVVGLALAEQQGTELEGARCRIDSLVLSCRVIGRGVETALLAAIAAGAAARGCRWLIGEYLPTKKNAPCAGFYDEHGFVRDDETGADGRVLYRLDLKEQMPASPAWLTLEGMPGLEASPTREEERTYELDDRTAVAS